LKRCGQARAKFLVTFAGLGRIKSQRAARFFPARQTFQNHRAKWLVVIPGRLREQPAQHRRDAGDGIKL
jgi:hypothetical protein